MPFQVIRQRDMMQCGPACLRMICLHYKRRISFEELAEFGDFSHCGMSLGDIQRAASGIGFDACCSLVDLSEMDNSCLPCILHWEDNHYVVLYKIRNRKYYIADPARGRYELGRDAFLKGWRKSFDREEGVALFLVPNEKFTAGEQSSGTDRRGVSLRALVSLFARYKRYFIILLWGLVLSCVIQLLLPFFSQAIVDIGIQERNLSIIWLIMIGEIALVLGNVAIEFTRKWLLLHIGMRINLSMLRDFFLKLFRLPMSFFESRLRGDILQRMADHSRVEEFLTIKFLSASFSVFSFLVFGAVLFIYDRTVFIVYLSGSILYALWVSCFLKKRRFVDYELFDNQANTKEVTYALVSNMQEIKLQGCENRRRSEWEHYQVDLYKTQMKSLKLTQWQESGSVLINQTKNLLTTVIAAASVIDGQITLGMMLSIQFIVGQLESPVEQLLQFINSIQDVKLSLERINEVHRKKDEEKTGQATLTQEDLVAGITLDHVSFKYNALSDVYALRDIYCHIPHRKTTAIVGSSGSGKSTLLKLILGFYDATEGIVSVGGKDVSTLRKKPLRELCGVVMQNGVIFSESIARNIAIEDGEIDYPRLEKAAAIAQLKDYIESLPLKYETVIGAQGMGLSQGQKQRILIARAIYKRPEVIILDEATNSLDATNESKISAALQEVCQNKTVIVVAHRLSTVKDADQIIVLDKGRIVEEGNHESLLQRKGAYYELVMNQLNLGE